MFKLCVMQISEISCTAIGTIGSDVIPSFRQDQLMFFNFFFMNLLDFEVNIAEKQQIKFQLPY